MRLLLGFTATCALLAAEPRRAGACTPPPCWPGYFVPVNGATVPANVPALYWQPMQSGSGAVGNVANVTLATTTNPTTLLPFTATAVPNTQDFVLVPDQPLIVGMSYLLDDRNTCSTYPMVGPKITFQTSTTIAPPGELGNLIVVAGGVGPLELWTSGGSCTSTVQAERVMISILLSAAAMPWRDAFHFETYVDGTRWLGNPVSAAPPGSTSHGRGYDMVFRVCEKSDPNVIDGVGPGVHEVFMRAHLPGTALEWTTAPVSIQLECTMLPEPPHGDFEDTPIDEDRGCAGCSASGSSSGLAVALLALARRKRRDREDEHE